jgi:hypothetical protein
LVVGWMRKKNVGRSEKCGSYHPRDCNCNILHPLPCEPSMDQFNGGAH